MIIVESFVFRIQRKKGSYLVPTSTLDLLVTGIFNLFSIVTETENKTSYILTVN